MATKVTKITAKFITSISQKVSIGAITGVLTSNDDINGVDIVSGRYGFTIDEGSSNVEYFEADVLGTALSNIVSINPSSLTETIGFTKEHRAGVEVKITDYAVLARIRALITGEADLDSGVPLKYDAVPTLSDPLQLATVGYVLSIVTGGVVTFNANVIAGMAGETIVSGEWVYFRESDGRWYKTDATDTTKSRNVRIGKARGAGTAGNGITGGVFVGGIETVGTYVAGTKYYLSNTPGALATSPGTENVLVGIGDGYTDLLFVSVYDVESVTYNEKQALVGTQGLPSSTNKYVTDDNTTASAVEQSQTTQNGSVEVGEANATTRKNNLAQSFTPVKTKIRGVRLYKTADTGVFTGTVTISLQANSGGNPSGVALATVTLSNAQWLALAVGEFEAIFAAEYASMVAGSLYWIVIDPSTSDNSNHPNLGTNTAGGYSGGSVKFQNTTDSWVAISTIDLYFKTIEGNKNQVVKTDADGYTLGVTRIPALTILDTASSRLGGSTTQFDVTNPTGTTFRYTYDSTGTDPVINSTTVPIGSLVDIQGQNFATANKGVFVVTGVGANYFEVDNATGSVESNKTIGTGYIAYSGTNFFTPSDNTSYFMFEVQGAGAGGRSNGSNNHSAGGGAGAYARKILQRSSIAERVPYIIGQFGTAEADGSATCIYLNGVIIRSGPGLTGVDDDNGGLGGTSTGGDINLPGGKGRSGFGLSGNRVGGSGGESQLGRGGAGGWQSDGESGSGYGSGGGGGADSSTGRNGGSGAKGAILIQAIA